MCITFFLFFEAIYTQKNLNLSIYFIQDDIKQKLQNWFLSCTLCELRSILAKFAPFWKFWFKLLQKLSQVNRMSWKNTIFAEKVRIFVIPWYFSGLLCQRIYFKCFINLFFSTMESKLSILRCRKCLINMSKKDKGLGKP